MGKRILSVVTAIICLLGPPLLGAYISGDQVREYLASHQSAFFHRSTLLLFHGPRFILILLLIIVVMITIFDQGLFITEKNREKPLNKTVSLWGWAGLIILIQDGSWPGPGFHGSVIFRHIPLLSPGSDISSLLMRSHTCEVAGL
jgi:uncharacterized protein YneF (UPF0154 family)